VLWKSEGGSWYLLAAGDRDTASITATGGVDGSAQGNLLAVKTKAGAQAGLKGELESGRSVNALR
jgi:hypothetical protein